MLWSCEDFSKVDSFTGFHRLLPDFTGFTQFHWFSLSITGLHYVLLSFIVFSCCNGFHWVYRVFWWCWRGSDGGRLRRRRRSSTTLVLGEDLGLKLFGQVLEHGGVQLRRRGRQLEPRRRRFRTGRSLPKTAPSFFLVLHLNFSFNQVLLINTILTVLKLVWTWSYLVLPS